MALESKFERNGFDLLEMTAAGGIGCDIYLKGTLLVLDDQKIETV